MVWQKVCVLGVFAVCFKLCDLYGTLGEKHLAKCQRNSWHLPYTLSMSFILCTCKSNGHSFQQKKKENRKLHETQI